MSFNKNGRIYSDKIISKALKERQLLIINVVRVVKAYPDALPADINLDEFQFKSNLEPDYMDRLQIEYPEFFI